MQTSWCVMASFSVVSEGLQLCQKNQFYVTVSFCCYRNGTGKLWQILRMSGGERRSLWKMPSSLVSTVTQSCVCCRSLPEHRMLIGGFSLPSVLLLFIAKCGMMFGLVCWCLGVTPRCAQLCYFMVLWTFLNTTGLVLLKVVLLTSWKLQVLLRAEK